MQTIKKDSRLVKLHDTKFTEFFLHTFVYKKYKPLPFILQNKNNLFYTFLRVRHGPTSNGSKHATVY